MVVTLAPDQREEPTPLTCVATRIHPDEYAALRRWAEARATTASAMLRDLIRAELERVQEERNA